MNARKSLVIVGCGSHAAVVLECARELAQFEVIGFVDDRRTGEGEYLGLPIWGALDSLSKLVQQFPSLMAITAIGHNSARQKAVLRAEQIQPAIRWATLVHPSAYVSPSARLGPGTMICAGSVIGTNAQLGQHVLINTGTCLDHDNLMGDFASSGPGVTTGGTVSVGSRSHLGIGATLLQRISIGADTVIGAQSLVTKDCEACMIYFGVPARFVRTRGVDENYLG